MGKSGYMGIRKAVEACPNSDGIIRIVLALPPFRYAHSATSMSVTEMPHLLILCEQAELATRRGFEPRLEGPKPPVLPLHHRVVRDLC